MKKVLLTTLAFLALGASAAVKNVPLTTSALDQFAPVAKFDQLLPANQEYQKTLKVIQKVVKSEHFLKLDIYDEEVASRVLAQYLSALDPEKLYFSKQEVENLEREFVTSRNSPITNNVASIYAVYGKFVQEKLKFLRMQAALLVGLKQQPNLNTKLEYQVDAKKRHWRDEAKVTLQDHAYLDLIRLIINEKLTRPTASWDQIRQRLMNGFAYQARDLKDYSDDEPMRKYYEGLGAALDAHSSFYLAKDAEDELNSFNSTFVGIGVQLLQDASAGGVIKVTSVLEGGPTAASGALHIDDEILEVSQNGKKFVDVTSMKIDDAVNLIRGPKGTNVWLRVEHPNGTKAVVKIKRGTVNQDFRARLATYTAQGKKLGVLTFDQFYTDLDNDIRRLLQNEPNLEGLIVDLRNNGGGQVQELLGIADVFLPTFTPVFQQTGSERENRGSVRPARPTSSQYLDVKFNKPLLVLTSRNSASASEIFAAAIQDLKRGYVLGETTYGKGTVQQYSDLEPFEHSDATRLTIQKFFRVTGGTTQFKGVEPDLVYPRTTPNSVGEASLPNPLRYSVVGPANYRELKNYTKSTYLKALVSKRDQFAASSQPYRDMVNAYTNYLQYLDQDKRPLNYLEQKRSSEQFQNYLLTAYNQYASLNKYPKFSNFQEYAKRAKRSQKPDPYLDLTKELLAEYVVRWEADQK